MIQLNDFKRMWLETRQDSMQTFERVGASGWYVLGPEVREFEAALAGFWGFRHCVGVASGLDGIEIALRLLGCKAGDRVLTTPVSAFATTLAIVRIGAVPIFIDIDEYGLIDLDLCRQILDTRHDIEFFVPVHLYGHALDSSQLAALREQTGLRIVEDCAQSIGSAFNGRPTGLAGHAAATSFYPTKNLGGMGDGGALLTDDVTVADAARAMRDYGQTAKYKHEMIGYNSRLDEVQAALLRDVYLPRQEVWTKRRLEIANRYLREIRTEHVLVRGAPRGSQSGWHLFPVRVDARDKAAFMNHLNESGILCGEHYPIAIPDQAALEGRDYESIGDLPMARTLCATEVSLPIHPFLNDDEVAHIVTTCNAWRP